MTTNDYHDYLKIIYIFIKEGTTPKQTNFGNIQKMGSHGSHGSHSIFSSIYTVVIKVVMVVVISKKGQKRAFFVKF